MLTILGSDHALSSRPMTIQQIEASGVLWFFTGKHGGLSAKIAGGTKANVTFSDHSDSLYVSVSGNARLIDVRQKAEELWSIIAKAWFPGGIDDPKLALVRMDVETAEYWESDHSKMMQLLLMAKSALTAMPPTSIGTHQKIEVTET